MRSFDNKLAVCGGGHIFWGVRFSVTRGDRRNLPQTHPADKNYFQIFLVGGKSAMHRSITASHADAFFLFLRPVGEVALAT